MRTPDTQPTSGDIHLARSTAAVLRWQHTLQRRETRSSQTVMTSRRRRRFGRRLMAQSPGFNVEITMKDIMSDLLWPTNARLDPVTN